MGRKKKSTSKPFIGLIPKQPFYPAPQPLQTQVQAAKKRTYTQFRYETSIAGGTTIITFFLSEMAIPANSRLTYIMVTTRYTTDLNNGFVELSRNGISFASLGMQGNARAHIFELTGITYEIEDPSKIKMEIYLSGTGTFVTYGVMVCYELI